jgi:ribosome-associated toxin RatA of RatAB toxin-antitoxin module
MDKGMSHMNNSRKLKLYPFGPLLLLIIFLLPTNIYGWELEKDEEGIRVYTRNVKGSHFKTYKAVMRVNASVHTLVNLVKDIQAYPMWIDTCKKGVLLKIVSKNEYLAYTVNNAPWPVMDRDAIVLNTVLKGPSKGSVMINIEGKHSYLPINDRIVRVKRIKGYWRFLPLKNGFSEVTYEVHSEPGGNIPAWLLNQIVVSQPFNTLKNMKKMVAHKKTD